MIKVMSKKRWDKLEQQFVELQLDLNSALDDNKTYHKQVELLVEKCKEQEQQISELQDEIEKLVVKKAKKKKEVKNEKEGNNA